MRRLLALLAFLPAAALAQETSVSYNYFGVGYARVEIEDDFLDESFDFAGYSIEGSVTVRDHFHLFGMIADIGDDEPGIDIDNLDLLAGIGTHFEPLEGFSVFGRLGVVKSSIDDSIDSFDDEGYYLAAGVRYMPIDWVELRAGVERIEYDDFDDGRASMFGADLYVTNVVALALEYRKHRDADAVTLGFRFYPGKEVRRGRAW